MLTGEERRTFADDISMVEGRSCWRTLKLLNCSWYDWATLNWRVISISEFCRMLVRCGFCCELDTFFYSSIAEAVCFSLLRSSK